MWKKLLYKFKGILQTSIPTILTIISTIITIIIISILSIIFITITKVNIIEPSVLRNVVFGVL